MISIKNRFTDEEIYRFDGDSLRYANLRKADLRYANFHRIAGDGS
jgi:uncharacterized protein YjbI with pentapeptide repeats